MSARYAVIGNPVAHSLSPRIHALFAAQLAEPIAYERILAPLDAFRPTVERFFAEGGAGANVTLPFKEEAFLWVTERDELAGAAGAVNTIARSGGGYSGSNTDGPGFMRDLDTIGVNVTGRRVLVIGAGGGVRGILGPLLAAAPAAVVLTNRTVERARVLVERLEDPRLSAIPVAALASTFDLVVNGTSASLADEVPDLPPRLVRGAFCYDMMYGAGPTAFMRWAERSGAAATADGLGMLVQQAALSFFLWRGRAPAPAPALAALRLELVSPGEP